MDPFVTIDAQKVLPNRLGLALASVLQDICLYHVGEQIAGTAVLHIRIEEGRVRQP